jgi:hypothetical protein
MNVGWREVVETMCMKIFFNKAVILEGYARGNLFSIEHGACIKQDSSGMTPLVF